MWHNVADQARKLQFFCAYDYWRDVDCRVFVLLLNPGLFIDAYLSFTFDFENIETKFYLQMNKLLDIFHINPKKKYKHIIVPTQHPPQSDLTVIKSFKCAGTHTHSFFPSDLFNCPLFRI